MKNKTLAFAFCMLFCAGMALPAAAAEGPNPGHIVNLNYMIGDWDSAGTNADQKYFPDITAVFGVNENWRVEAEYMDAGSDIANDGSRVESRRYQFGARYEFALVGGYVSLGYAKMLNDVSVGGIKASVDVDGLRLGGGVNFPIENTAWTANLDLGIGVGNNSVVSMGGVSGSFDGDAFDASLGFAYRFPKTGLTANIGYEYFKIKAEAPTSSLTIKSKGPFLGVGYHFD